MNSGIHDTFNPEKNIISNSFQFNGYTNYWHDIRNNWISYGNLFKIAVPDADYTIAQSKVDIADDMKIPGLSVQEGFMNDLLKGQYSVLDQPSIQKLADAAAGSNVLVLVDPETDTGKKLAGKLPANDMRKETLKSHQFNARDFTEVNAYYLENGTRRIFVISSESSELRKSVSELIDKTKRYLTVMTCTADGSGLRHFLKSVTCTAGHPLEVIGKGMNEGNTLVYIQRVHGFPCAERNH